MGCAMVACSLSASSSPSQRLITTVASYYILYGGWLLVASMVGSLLFEGYHHFLVISPDHVSQVPPGTWGDVFRITAVASVITEVLAVAAGIAILGAARATPVTKADGPGE